MASDRYRTFWARVGAGVIDGLVLWPLGVLDDLLMSRGFHSGFTWFVWCTISSALPLAYSILFHWREGRTPGKMVMTLKVLDVGERRLPSFKQAFLRDIGPVVLSAVALIWAGVAWMIGMPEQESQTDWPSIILGLAGLGWFILEVITMLMDDRSRALHDHIAGTVVVRE